ncbi:MAG: LLM class flavin-dependent oxidoreductase [SAR324 cluster bacterium]|nr:LLM class flavin-dependent oxidoreductase [SAR324 cluster bacterium]MCH8886972.1 LLM class flavin-dependent oxidoreductase [SAR324 cluster bacterium]
MSHPLNIGLYLLSPSEPAGIERAAWAEEHGYSTVWVPDGEGKMHALTLAGALAASTSSIRIAIGIVPVFTHTPAVLAAAALTLSHLAPGRIVMGLGASAEGMIEGWHGIPYQKPLTRVRETTLALQAMLAGERSDFAGETLTTKGFKLLPPLKAPVPVYLAALRPKMLELAGELADGVVMHLAPMSLLPGMLASVAAGAKRSGRELSSLDIACRFNVVMAKNKAEAMEPAREFIQRYFTAPIYRRFFEWCGFEAEAEAFEKGFREKDRAATRAAITDRVVETFCIVGAPEECREQVAAFHAAGITSPAINACTTDPQVAQRIFEAFLPEHF